MVNKSLKKLWIGHTLYFIGQPKILMNGGLTRFSPNFLKNRA